MNGLVAAAVLLPTTAVLALALRLNSRSEHVKGDSVDGIDQSSNSADATECSKSCYANSAAAAAAAEAVRQGSCGKLVSSSSCDSLQLQLPPLLGAELKAGAGRCGSHATCIPVTAGRPQLQPLVEGWMAMLRQLPQAAGSLDSSSSSRDQKEAKREVFCRVYAMGPAPLVADAQVLCGGIKGLHFVQKTYQM
jgi:hypothetical protein